MSSGLVLDEADRQMVLLALAHLSVARPGWEHALHLLALQIDNQNNGRALMFDEFRATCRTEVVELKQRLESKQNALMILVGQRDGTTPVNDHKARHALLHAMLDELVADWLQHTKKRPSSSSVLELMNWANEQRLHPMEP